MRALDCLLEKSVELGGVVGAWHSLSSKEFG